MSRILIAEDEERIYQFVDKGLRAAGYTTSVATDGIRALDYATSGEFDLMILDVGLPRLDGFSVLAMLRGTAAAIPVIMVTARTSVTDTVNGLEGGADDYLAKPFRFEELLARIRLRLRAPSGPRAETVMCCGSLQLDLRTRTALVDGRVVELSARQFSMAEMFMQHAGQVLSRQQLLSHVWGYDFAGASNVVDVYVSALRQKFGANRLVTIRGVGYRLVSD